MNDRRRICDWEAKPIKERLLDRYLGDVISSEELLKQMGFLKEGWWPPNLLDRERRSMRRRSYRALREKVWERDSHRCQVCGRIIEKSEYWCGHKIDRMCGGPDASWNLEVQCIACNYLKSLHETLEEYEAWKAKGGVAGDLERWWREELEATNEMLLQMRQSKAPK